MRKFLVMNFVLFSFWMNGHAQNIGKRGYIAFAIGPHFVLQQNKLPYYSEYLRDPNDFGRLAKINIPAGINLQFINFGFRLGERMGMAFTWYGSANEFSKSKDYKLVLRKGGILVGPMYSIPISKKIYVDIKARIGREVINFYEEINSQNMFYSRDFSYVTRIYEAGTSIRYNFSDKWSAIGNVEYQIKRYNNNVLNITAGLGFRI